MNTQVPVSFTIGEKVVDAVIVKGITYSQFVAIAHSAQVMTNPATIEGRLMRARMVQQVDYFKEGKPVALSIEELLKMPFPVARKIQGMFDDNIQKRGKIVGEGDQVGDGITSPIRYELGTPIELADGKGSIRELEFMATTYGELEDVISGTDPLEQTLSLIKSIAKPVHDTLQTLPSWGVEKISTADGFTIAELILPRFL